MAFLTDEQVLQALADIMGNAEKVKLDKKWTNIAAAANIRAQGKITRKLIELGYSPAQILLWDDGVEFNRCIAVWYGVSEGGAAGSFDATYLLEIKDCVKELEDGPTVIIDGVVVVPAGVVGAPLKHGDMVRDDNIYRRSVKGDRFRW